MGQKQDKPSEKEGDPGCGGRGQRVAGYEPSSEPEDQASSIDSTGSTGGNGSTDWLSVCSQTEQLDDLPAPLADTPRGEPMSPALGSEGWAAGEEGGSEGGNGEGNAVTCNAEPETTPSPEERRHHSQPTT